MSLQDQSRVAEAVQRQRLLFAGFILLLGLGSGIRALEFPFPRQEFAWINLAHNGVAVAQVGLLLFILLGLFRLRRTCRAVRVCQRQVLMDGFVERTSLIALSASWFLTLLLAMLLSEWTEPEVLLVGQRAPGSLFPAPYYFSLLICCMAVSYGLAFFGLYLADAGGTEREAQ